MVSRKVEIFLEFFVFGVVMGIIEDLIAVKATTGVTITWNTIGIIVLITIPFAIIGEILVDKNHLISVTKKKKSLRKKQ